MSKQPKKIRKLPSKTQKKISKQPKKEEKAIPKKESKIVKKAEKKIEKPIVKKDIPSATIYRPLKHITKIRNGKGFSRPELLSINIDTKKARRLGLQVDPRRSTKLDVNVDALKNWFTIPIATPKKIQKTKSLKTQK